MFVFHSCLIFLCLGTHIVHHGGWIVLPQGCMSAFHAAHTNVIGNQRCHKEI